MSAVAKTIAPLRRVGSPSCAWVEVDGRHLLSFGGSGYLGLGDQPDLIEAGVAALRRFGVHSQLGRHYGYALGANLEAEQAARAFFDVDGAMYFGSGYLFGLIAMPALADFCDAIFIDEAAHYSLRDGARASGRPVHTFLHCDAADLGRQLARKLPQGGRPMVATDGMFATRGTIAPLDAYAALLKRHAGWLVVDESHAFGVLGAQGRGAVEACGIARDRVVAGGSMAKAFGAHGGIALGAAAVIERLWRTPAARGAALGCSAGAAMTARSLQLVRLRPELRARLHTNAQLLKRSLRHLGLAIDDNGSPIAAFIVDDAQRMRNIQEALMKEDIFIAYSNYVGAGPEGILRVAAFADHLESDISRLQVALGRILLGAPARMGLQTGGRS
ncbi:glycine C-acetyltransferase/8-amino-7-oxononanoate synthase/serine palmitoyltransferase [Duganella sacchari]|uniref:Glycine C-acetyltransferase/8-amino-7-oxononanoate synthase/serine palmitoyltransferase n=1 Tax=Duganella sacchari TaxID=551987 RepID=A0A1M7I5Q1_9BURK|nr:pyridoxal phosphate-dependent aminotransferase family protein [Duganella sacchari]SHM36040.1 glycine C-acetyltransferase/8-amino-7-oxononanoate synthase/serine palmitoyltransferase [Duganella sacchari]